MNKHLHRIIFNAARGQRMVVQETAASAGKVNGATNGRAGPTDAAILAPAFARLNLMSFAALLAVGATLQWAPVAQAQIAVDANAPRSQQATVVNTANGLPQVNIQTPSAAGVSRNTFTQFDIQQQGAILNNSRTNVQTQLGGFIQGNPSLAGGSARIILNEINSSNPTQLRGFVEVAGQRAEVIIANPAGVNINGGGFINASRATITTGTPVINGGNLEGFVVQKGLITINGAGLDSSQTDFTGLMARAIEVNAGIWAKELKLTAGANQVNADQSVATAAPGAALGAAPAFGIDTSQLGGMYAGKITLVGTEAGLGVRNAGTLAATAGNIAISADGLLTNTATGRMTSSGDTNLNTRSLANDGQISAAGRTGIALSDTLTNSGTIAGQQTSLQAGVINNLTTGRLEGGSLDASASQSLSNAGNIIATGQLNVSSTGTLTNQGKLAGQQATVQAAMLNNQGSGRIEADTLDVTAQTVNNTAGIAGNTVTVNAGTLNNQGASALVAGTAQVNLYVRDALNNTGGATVYSLGGLNIAANSTRDADGTLLNRTTLVNNNTSLLQADGDMQIAAETLNNTRAAPQITSTTSSTSTTLLKRDGYWMCEYGNYVDSFAGFCAAGYADLSWYNPAIHINPLAEKPGVWIGGHAVETERYITTTVTDEQLQGALQAEPKILAGNNLILKNVGNLRNEYGSITAGQNVTIGNADPLGSYQTASVTNIGAVLNRNTVVDEYSIFRWNRSYGTSTSQSLAPQASTAVLSRISGTMSAGGTFSINATTVTNTNALPGQSSVAGPASPGPAGAAFSLPALGALVIPPLTGPGQRYLIESDPRFTSYRQWLSSDYMLTALNTDPALIQKRLGDGFYEQKLIRDQVGQLTGRRFLDGYTSEEAQYQALMASGVTVAQQWNLRPGIALTAAQISQLTSDIVWLVEQTVTLSDGSKTQAWVPVVYLSQTHAADLHPTGALISGKSVSIAAKGDLSNRGALQAQDSILLAANKVTNELGLIDASRGSTAIVSDTDIINRSGMISGNSVLLNAGRDIQIDAVTRQFSASRQTIAGNVSGSNTEVGPQGSVVSRGDLAINAGRDIKLAGALVSAQGNASLNAGANLVVDTIQTQQSTQDVSGVGLRRTQGTTNLGSTLQTGGNLALSSGADTTLRAAQIGVGQDLSVIANGNLNILAATDTAQLDENIRAKGYVRNDHTAQERVVGSNLVAGGNVTLAALQTAPDGSKGNITVQGSSVNAVTGQLNVVAANNVNIIEAREKGEYDLFNETKGSKTFSSKTQTAHDTGSSDIAVGSALSGREVSIVAGKDLTVRGSSVVSDTKTTLLATNNITIEAAKNFETSTTFREEKKSGLMSSGGIGFTVGSKQQSTDQQNTRTSASASTLGSIAGNVTATAGNNYRQVGSDVLAPAGNVTISAQKVDIVEARETTRSATEEKFKQSGVTLSLGSPLISAVQGAQNMAQAASQTSDGRMQALAAATTALNLYSNQKEIGDAAKALASGDVSKAVSLSISLGSSKSQNSSNSASDSARGSSITAGGDVTISALGAGQDSNITVQGSTINAGNNAKLLADNEIKLLAAKNDYSQTSSNSSSSGSIGLSIGASTGVTLSASKARGNSDGTDTSYTNTVIQAGNTASLSSGGDTTLKGAVVAANQVKADVGGDLSIQSLQDTSTFTGQQSSSGASITIGPGFIPTGGGFSASKSNINSNYASVVQQSGIKAGDGGFQVDVGNNTDLKGGVIASNQAAIDNNKNTFTTGGTLNTSDIQNSASYEGKAVGISVDVGQQGGKYGVSGVGAGIGSDMGEASSVTTAGISGIAGNTAVRSTDAEAGIQKIFDAAKVQREINAQVQITQAFSKEAPKAVANYAGIQLAALNAQLKDETDPDKRAALQADITKWSEGGAYRVALHTLTGALSGGVSGAAGAAAIASSADLMTDLQNGIRNSLISAGLGADAAGVVAQGVATLTAAGVGAAVGGAQGAAAASTVDANNRQLHPNERTLIEKLAKDKAKQVCQGNTECETLSAVKWADLMERAAEGQTGSSAYEKNLQYLTSLAQASAQPGSEGAMGGLDRYLNDLQTAQALLSPYAGKPITVNGQVVTANGAPQTYFGATPEQYGDPYANTLLGYLPTSIVAGMDQRDQLRLEQMIVQNGSATPLYPVEELLLGGAVGTRVLTAIGRAAGSLDVFLAGRATASSGGNISARQITEEALPVRLSAVEQAALHQIDSLPSTSAQGKLREYIADSYFARNSFTQLEGKCGSGNCFDGVFVKGNKVYINEVKPLNANGSIQLSGPSGNMATQMSDSWIESAISRLELSGNTEALRTAAVIRDAIRREALVKVVTGVNQNGMTIVKLN